MSKRRLSTTLAAICALGVIALVALAASATAGSSRSKDVYIDFRMPSNNIFCAYISSSSPHYTYLRCDIVSGLRPKPSDKGCVEGTRAETVEMNKTGKSYYGCASDSVYNHHTMLAYGKTWRHGGFTCKSKTSGLRCTNMSSHGFSLSRKHSYLF